MNFPFLLLNKLRFTIEHSNLKIPDFLKTTITQHFRKDYRSINHCRKEGRMEKKVKLFINQNDDWVGE